MASPSPAPMMRVAPAGPARRFATTTLDALLGFLALPVFWLTEALAWQALCLAPMDLWTGRITTLAPCLLWLAALTALARRGRTPVSILTRLRWTLPAGRPASWRPCGSLSFWVAAFPALYTLIMFGEYLYTGGMAPFMGWTDPISDSLLYIGTTCLAIVALAVPPYLRFRRQPACARCAAH